MIKNKDIINSLFIIRVLMASHLGINPINGGSPPNDINIIIKINEVIKFLFNSVFDNDLILLWNQFRVIIIGKIVII